MSFISLKKIDDFIILKKKNLKYEKVLKVAITDETKLKRDFSKKII